MWGQYRWLTPQSTPILRHYNRTPGWHSRLWQKVSCVLLLENIRVSVNSLISTNIDHKKIAQIIICHAHEAEVFTLDNSSPLDNHSNMRHRGGYRSSSIFLKLHKAKRASFKCGTIRNYKLHIHVVQDKVMRCRKVVHPYVPVWDIILKGSSHLSQALFKRFCKEWRGLF